VAEALDHVATWERGFKIELSTAVGFAWINQLFTAVGFDLLTFSMSWAPLELMSIDVAIFIALAQICSAVNPSTSMRAIAAAVAK